MTPERIAEIRARVDAARPRWWKADLRPEHRDIYSPMDDGSHFYQVLKAHDHTQDADLVFAAEARQDIPDLLDELDAATERIGRLKAALEPLRARLMNGWFRIDESERYSECSVCDSVGPSDDFLHHDDCPLGAVLAALAAPTQEAAGAAEPITGPMCECDHPKDEHVDLVFQCKRMQRDRFCGCARFMFSASARPAPRPDGAAQEGDGC